MSQNVCETGPEILNIAVTAEALAVTALGGALQSAIDGDLQLSDEQFEFVVATHASERLHYDLLIGLGAEPLTRTFTLPDEAIVTDVETFLATVEGLDEAFIAAYMAAAQIFAVWGEADLAALATQIGGVEAEHRAHARFFSIQEGFISGVPNNRAYSRALFSGLGEAAGALEDLGWIGGPGPELVFPGPVEPDMSGLRVTAP
jgi:hypothetical protein